MSGSRFLLATVAVLGGAAVAQSPKLRVSLRRSVASGLRTLSELIEPTPPFPPPMWSEDDDEEQEAPPKAAATKPSRKMTLEQFQNLHKQDDTTEEEED